MRRFPVLFPGAARTSPDNTKRFSHSTSSLVKNLPGTMKVIVANFVLFFSLSKVFDKIAYYLLYNCFSLSYSEIYISNEICVISNEIYIISMEIYIILTVRLSLISIERKRLSNSFGEPGALAYLLVTRLKRNL